MPKEQQTAIVAFRCRQELKDQFKAYCDKYDDTVSAKLKRVMRHCVDNDKD
jgi:antitoxin component of RelBE/YafQ-DinJ toxin-antitoxin module